MKHKQLNLLIIFSVIIFGLVASCSNPFFPPLKSVSTGSSPEVPEIPEEPEVPIVPVILEQPSDTNYPENYEGDVSLTVKVGTGSGIGALSYQWYGKTEDDEDFELIDGATSSSYMPPTDIEDIFYYYVVVTNTLNGQTEEVTSSIAKVIVTTPQIPNITKHPASKNYVPGQTAEDLTVEATVADGGTISYQWYVKSDEDWQPIFGETAANFEPDTHVASIFEYRVEVINTKNGFPSEPAVSDTATIIVVILGGEVPELTVIAAVSVEVGLPFTGEVPITADGAIVPAGAHYTVTALSWEPADAVFKKSETYTVTVEVTAKEGYFFMFRGLNARINDDRNNTDVEITDLDALMVIELSYTFEIPDGITLMLDSIKDAGLTLDDDDEIVLIRGGEKVSITVQNEGYAIEWYYGGNKLVTGVSGDNGETLTLSVNQSDSEYNIAYDIIGKRYLTVKASKTGEPPSVKTIVFEVKE